MASNIVLGDNGAQKEVPQAPSMDDAVPDAAPVHSSGSCAVGDSTCSSGDGADSPGPEHLMPAQEPPGDLIAPSMAPGPISGCDSSLDIAMAETELSVLVQAFQAANLTDMLAADDAAVTVLAPSNAAFANIPEDELKTLLADKANLTQVRRTCPHAHTTTLHASHAAPCRLSTKHWLGIAAS
jgi:hypothetical protein